MDTAWWQKRNKKNKKKTRISKFGLFLGGVELLLHELVLGEHILHHLLGVLCPVRHKTYRLKKILYQNVSSSKNVSLSNSFH
jgi:hypothetical protein